MASKKEKELTRKIIHSETFPEMVQGFVDLHQYSPNTSDESIENRNPETPKICPRASRERKPTAGKTNWEIRMEHERKRSASRGQNSPRIKEKLISANSTNTTTNHENPTPQSSIEQSINRSNTEASMDETLQDPEEKTPRIPYQPSRLDKGEGQIVSEYRTEKNIIRIRRVTEFSPIRNNNKTPLKVKNTQYANDFNSAPRPTTSSGLREHTKNRISKYSSHTNSLPSSPQVERKNRPIPSHYVSKIPLRRESSLENKMKSIEKEVHKIQKQLKMNNVKNPKLVVPNDVCTETNNRDLTLHETVCDAGARIRQKLKDGEEELERSHERLSTNSNNSTNLPKTPSPNKMGSRPESAQHEIPIPIYRPINHLITTPSSSPSKSSTPYVRKNNLSAENPLLELGQNIPVGEENLVDPYQISRVSRKEPLEISNLHSSTGKTLDYTPITMPRRQLEDENGYAIPGSTRTEYMNVTNSGIFLPLAESTPLKLNFTSTPIRKALNGIDKIGYRTPSPVERVFERKRVNRNLGFDDLVKADDPSMNQLTPTKYERVPSLLQQENGSNSRRNVSFSPQIQKSNEESYTSAIAESFDTVDREDRLSKIFESQNLSQKSPYRSASMPIKTYGSSPSTTTFSSGSIKSSNEATVSAEQLNKSLEQVNEALDRTRVHLDDIVDQFDQTINNVNMSIHMSQSLTEIQSFRRSPAYKSVMRPRLTPSLPPEMIRSSASKQLFAMNSPPQFKGERIKPTLTSPPPEHKPSTFVRDQDVEKNMNFDRKNMENLSEDPKSKVNQSPFARSVGGFDSEPEQTGTIQKSQFSSAGLPSSPKRNKQTAASVTMFRRAEETFKLHKEALKNYTKVKILIYNIRADEYKKSGRMSKSLEIKSKIDELIEKLAEEKKLVKEAYRNPTREILKEGAKKIEAIQNETIKMQEKVARPSDRRRRNSISSNFSSSSSITTASMMKDEEYTQKMNVLRQRRENADRILRIAQKLKKEEKDIERLEKKAFTSINQISMTSEVFDESSFSEKDIPRKLATVVKTMEILVKDESPPPTAGRALDYRNARLREELEKKRRFSEKLYKEFCKRNKEMLQNEEISLNTQIDAYNKYIEEARKLEEFEKISHCPIFSEKDDEAFTTGSVKLSHDSTPERRESMELDSSQKISTNEIHSTPKISTSSSSQTPKLSASIPRLSLSSESTPPKQRVDSEKISADEEDEKAIDVKKTPHKILTPVESSVPRLDLSALHREFSVETKEKEKNGLELLADVAFKQDGYEKDIQKFVRIDRPVEDENKETSRGISSIHEFENIPPPVVEKVLDDVIDRKPRYAQTSADREKNTENDVSSIQDIQEMPDSTPRPAVESIKTPMEIEKKLPSNYEEPPQPEIHEKSEGSVFSAMSPLENVLNSASSLESLPMDNAISGLDELPDSGKTDQNEIEEPSQSPSKAMRSKLEVMSGRRNEERDKESDPERVPSAKSHLNLSNSSLSKREDEEHSPIPTPPYVEPSVITSIGTGGTGPHDHMSARGSRIISQFSTSSRTSSSMTISSAGGGRKSSSENIESTSQKKVENQIVPAKLPSSSSISSLSRKSSQDLFSPPPSSTLKTPVLNKNESAAPSKTPSISSTITSGNKSLDELMSPSESSSLKINWQKVETVKEKDSESIVEEIVEEEAETVEDSSIAEETPKSELSDNATKTEAIGAKSFQVVVTHTETVTTTTLTRSAHEPIITTADTTPHVEEASSTVSSTQTSESESETEEVATESESSTSSSSSENNDDDDENKPVAAKENAETESSIAEEIVSEEIKSAESVSSSLVAMSSSKEDKNEQEIRTRLEEEESSQLADKILPSNTNPVQKPPMFYGNNKPLSLVELADDEPFPEPPKPLKLEESHPKPMLSPIVLEDDYSPAARMEKTKAKFVQKNSLPPLTHTDSLDTLATNATPKQSPRSPLFSDRYTTKFPRNLNSPKSSPRNSIPARGSPRFSTDKDLIMFSPRDTSDKIRTTSVSSEKSILDESERSTGRLSKSSVGFLEESLHATNLLDLSSISANPSGKTSLCLGDLKTDAILEILQPQNSRASTIPEEESLVSTISSEFQISTASGTTESSSSATVSAVEPSLPNSENQIRYLVQIFSKQLWPQFESGRDEFVLNVAKIENGKSQHDEYETSFIESLADFTVEIVKQMASNSKYYGINRVSNKFYFHPRPTSNRMFSKMVEDEVCARALRIRSPEITNGMRRLVEPRYVRVSRFPPELDPIDHILLNELYQTEPAWIDSISEFLEKVEKLNRE